MMSSDATAFDSVLDSCQNQHRRIVLRTVAEEQRSVTLDELTKIVFRHTHQTPFTEASEDVLTRIRLSLYQAHLPKLASKGLINYDSERQLVEPTEQGEQVQETLSTILGADPSLEAPIEL